MFSDADPVVALDPKQQHRELTKPGICTGIPVAVYCVPKTNNTLCRALIFLENRLSPVCFVLGNAIFLVIKASAVCAAVVAARLNLRCNSLHLNLKERILPSSDSRLLGSFHHCDSAVSPRECS